MRVIRNNVLLIGLLGLASICGFLGASLGYNSITKSKKMLIINSVTIIDGKYGADLDLYFDRQVKERFHGTWKVYIVDVSTGKMALDSNGKECRGFGISDYEPTEQIDQPVKLFEWWMERENCLLEPGKYFAETEWRSFPHTGSDDYADTFFKRSNIFTITH